MVYSTHLSLLLTTLLVPEAKSKAACRDQTQSDPDLSDVVQPALQKVLDLVDAFRQQPVSPANTHRFEQQLQDHLLEVGRQVSQWTYNHLEPSEVADLAKHVSFQAGPYTRLNRRTPQNAWTLFGQIRLCGTGYRPTHKDGDPTIFPLAMALGLVHGASPSPG